MIDRLFRKQIRDAAKKHKRDCKKQSLLDPTGGSSTRAAYAEEDFMVGAMWVEGFVRVLERCVRARTRKITRLRKELRLMRSAK